MGKGFAFPRMGYTQVLPVANLPQAKRERMFLRGANLPAGKEGTDVFVCGKFADRQRANGRFCLRQICRQAKSQRMFLLAANLPAGKEPTDVFCLWQICRQAKSQRMFLLAANLPTGKEPTDVFACGAFAFRQRAECADRLHRRSFFRLRAFARTCCLFPP